MQRSKIIQKSILSAKAANGVGTTISGVSDFKNLELELTSASSANLTVKVQGSFAETAPDFSTAASATNPWFYVALYDLESPGAIINGSTGIVFAGTDAVYGLIANVDGLQHINAIVSGYAAGNATLKLNAYDNN